MKRFIALLVALVLCCSFTLPATANDNEVAPAFANTFFVQSDFEINRFTGEAVVSAKYLLYFTTGITVEIYVSLDKKDGETMTHITHWRERSTQYFYDTGYSEFLTECGTYVATFTYTATDQNGVSDNVTQTFEKTF